MLETDRFHRTEPEGIDTARGHLLDRKTPLEVDCLFEVVQWIQLCVQKRGHEPFVLLAINRGIQIVASRALVVPRHPVPPGEINVPRSNDRRDRVVEIKPT